MILVIKEISAVGRGQLMRDHSVWVNTRDVKGGLRIILNQLTKVENFTVETSSALYYSQLLYSIRKRYKNTFLQWCCSRKPKQIWILAGSASR